MNPKHEPVIQDQGIFECVLLKQQLMGLHWRWFMMDLPFSKHQLRLKELKMARQELGCPRCPSGGLAGFEYTQNMIGNYINHVENGFFHKRWHTTHHPIVLIARETMTLGGTPLLNKHRCYMSTLPALMPKNCFAAMVRIHGSENTDWCYGTFCGWFWGAKLPGATTVRHDDMIRCLVSKGAFFYIGTYAKLLPFACCRVSATIAALAMPGSTEWFSWWKPAFSWLNEATKLNIFFPATFVSRLLSQFQTLLHKDWPYWLVVMVLQGDRYPWAIPRILLIGIGEPWIGGFLKYGPPRNDCFITHND